MPHILSVKPPFLQAWRTPACPLLFPMRSSLLSSQLSLTLTCVCFQPPQTQLLSETPYSKALERKKERERETRLLGPAIQSQNTWPPSRHRMGPERHVLADHQAMHMLGLYSIKLPSLESVWFLCSGMAILDSVGYRWGSEGPKE